MNDFPVVVKPELATIVDTVLVQAPDNLITVDFSGIIMVLFIVFFIGGLVGVLVGYCATERNKK